MHPALWHPFADMGSVEANPLVLVRGEGSWVFAEDGRRFLDATASLWYSNLGHGREDIVEAVAEQMRTLDAYNTFGDFANPPATELADRIAALTGRPGTRVFLSSGGGDAIETAAKIARAYHVHRESLRELTFSVERSAITERTESEPASAASLRTPRASDH